MCELDWDEPAEFWNEIERKARKQHVCSGCRRTIEPGEKYVVHSSKFDGELYSEKMCADCNASRAVFAKAHQGMMPSPGALEHTLVECIADGDEESEKVWKPMLEELRARGEGPTT